MDTVGSYEAKTHLSRLLDRVAKGSRFTITRNGKAVAMLVPIDSDTPDAMECVRRMKELRKGKTLGGISIRELIEEGRRY